MARTARKVVPYKIMPAPLRDLTDDQCAILDQLIPEPKRRPDGRGRPWRPRHDVLNGIL